MSFVLVHLSDIHIKTAADRVLKKGRQIAAAISAACQATHRCIIVCTGDIAYSGSGPEYYHALQFLAEIADTLRAEGKEVSLFTVPGNHDCALSPPDPIREAILTSVRNDPHQADSAEVQEHCLQAQDEYRKLDEQIASEVDGALRLARDIELGSIVLRLVNSAWMSSIHEGPGTLVFPAASITDIGDKFTITCLHHPPQWYTPSTRRELWRVLAQSSDLILTGHEHESAQSHISSPADKTLYSHFEGAVLQQDGLSDESSFVVYIIDPAERTYEVYEYHWKGKEKEYRFQAPAGHLRPQAVPLPLNRIRSLRSFEYSASHVAFLDALTMNVTHPSAGELRLRDVFVYPDLICSAGDAEDVNNVEGKAVRGEDVVNLIQRTPRIMLTGERYSGRTALAKTLCVDLQERGYVPIYLRLNRQMKTTAAWIDAAERAFCDQYDPSRLQAFQQLSPTARVIVVDDVDQCCGAADVFAIHLEEVGRYAGHIVISADMASLGMRTLLKIAQEGIPHYQIRPFGYRQREQLVKKWLLLGGEQRDGQALVRKFHEATKTLNGIVGKGFVPSYPFFVLTILHAAESVVQLETKTSAQGYYFEQLIRTELQRGKQDQVKLDVVLGVLSFLAFRFFVDERQEMNDSELRGAVRDYEKEYALSLDYGVILAHLIERRMLAKRGEKFVFAYDYVYYFFVARHLSRNIERDDIKAHVSELCRMSRYRRSGDILLFLAHFSNDSFVISQMLRGAEEAYAGYGLVDLKRDSRIIGQVSESAIDVVYEEHGDALETRRQVAEAHDRQAERHGVVGREIEPDTEVEAIRRLIAALRNMEVVGQVLKNNPGHLSAEKKKELALAAYGVGARIWRWFLEFIAEDKKALVDDIIAHVRAERPAIGKGELRLEVSDRLNALVRIVSFSMVKRIAMSIGAPELEQTYRSVIAALNGADAARLVVVSVVLDCFASSAEGEVAEVYAHVKESPISVWVLQQLALEHLHLFQLESAEKQRLCAAVGIRYQSGLAVGQRTKRLPRGSE